MFFKKKKNLQKWIVHHEKALSPSPQWIREYGVPTKEECIEANLDYCRKFNLFEEVAMYAAGRVNHDTYKMLAEILKDTEELKEAINNLPVE